MSDEGTQKTDFKTRCEILSELWLGYRWDEEFKDFLEYNDIGLPLAFLVTEKLVDPSQQAIDMVDETFDILAVLLEVEDTGFESLDDMMLG
jgi:hypothetical protein